MTTKAPPIDALLVRLRRERIEAVLGRVRPLLRQDGIDLELVAVREDGASVRLTGLSPGCAAAPLNLQSGLEEVLRAEVAGFGELRLDIAPAAPKKAPKPK